MATQSAEQLFLQQQALQARIAELERQLADECTQRIAAEQLSGRLQKELAALHQSTVALMHNLNVEDVLKTIVTSAAQLVDTANGFIYLVNEQEHVLETKLGIGYHDGYVGFRLGYGEGLSGKVWQTGQPVIINNYATWPQRVTTLRTPSFHSIVGVPLLRNQVVVGVIGLSFNDGRTPDSATVELLSSFAQLASIALENARLYTAAQRRAQELEALRVTMTEISANLDLETLLRAILERQVALLGATAGELGLYEPERQQLYMVASHNMGRDSSGTWLTLEEGMMGQVARTRLPLVLQNYNLWEGRSLRYQDFGAMTALAVPMLAGDQLIGVLAVGDTNLGRVFAEEDLRLLSLFAQQATIAIQNGRLFADIQRLATIDPLTGLANRRAFFALAQHEFERTQRSGKCLAALMIDVDDFKRVNDRYGHAVGDRVLNAIGRRCREALRSIDVIGRYGGEEVAIVLPDSNQHAAQQVAERIRMLLADQIDTDVTSITVSVGVAIYEPPEPLDLDQLIDRADRAQYMAKHAGKNRVVVWTSPSATADSAQQHT